MNGVTYIKVQINQIHRTTDQIVYCQSKTYLTTRLSTRASTNVCRVFALKKPPFNGCGVLSILCQIMLEEHKNYESYFVQKKTKGTKKAEV